jgi:hypothetical protein
MLERRRVLSMFLPNTVTRIDRVGLSHNFTIHEFVPTEHPIRSERRLSTTDAFVFDLTCGTGVSTTLCNNARTGLQNSGRRIAETLSITTPITVRARFARQGDPNILGGAMYGSAFFIRKNGRFYTMAQALVKQLKTDVAVTFSSADIVAEFNSEVNWFFRTGNNTISSSQTDFEYVTAHELTHGLGFGSGYLEFSSIFTGARTGYIVPNMIGASSPEATTSTIFRALEPIDIFDSFVTPLNEAGARIANFPIQSATFDSFIRSFERSGDPFNAARQAFQAATSSLTFVNGATGVNLYTPTGFQQGSSISHVRLSQANTPDFLMIPQLRPGVNMDDLITTSLYGPATRAIMEAIGWTTNSTAAGSVTLGMNYGTGPVGSLPSYASGIKHCWLLTLLCILLNQF